MALAPFAVSSSGALQSSLKGKLPTKLGGVVTSVVKPQFPCLQREIIVSDFGEAKVS